MNGRWDPGLQIERTHLSWRRTSLALTAGMVLTGRYLGAPHPTMGIILPVLALVLGVVLLWRATIRVQQVEHVIQALTIAAPTPEKVPSGALLAVITVLVLLAVATATAYVLAAGAQG
ncbi:MAG TPA: DUF202 domain-containing protein [Beutenbergiaceae bacterium]|nr:DUF202 domain-containing protein [Beutenbergiaceae bacterium]